MNQPIIQLMELIKQPDSFFILQVNGRAFVIRPIVGDQEMRDD